LREDKCLEVFVLEGDAARIKELVRLFQITGKMDYVKLIVA
jgi:CopG family nickel-responsive transcriptional regulator